LSQSGVGEIQGFQIFVKPASFTCNLKCSYCYYLESGQNALPQPRAGMAKELLEHYIRSHIAACRGPEVFFSWHGGEPTLLGVSFFRRVVQLQKQWCPAEKSIQNGIQTNGTLIDEEWADFFADNDFRVGLSLDGPAELHDEYRRTAQGQPTFAATLNGYQLLVARGVAIDLLCVVNDCNVLYPLQVYRFFKEIGATHLSFLPLVERQQGDDMLVSARSVPPEAFGAFLSVIFDEWKVGDIGRIKVQIFEEALRTAFHQDHSLCLFRQVCGEIPVLEQNGDVYACDHFVEPEWKIGNIRDDSLTDILTSEKLRGFGKAKKTHLPEICKKCEVLAMCNGECPKNRFMPVAGESEKLNYLCAGYRLFFNHCRPFVEAVAEQWRNDVAVAMAQSQASADSSTPVRLKT